VPVDETGNKGEWRLKWPRFALSPCPDRATESPPTSIAWDSPVSNGVCCARSLRPEARSRASKITERAQRESKPVRRRAAKGSAIVTQIVTQGVWPTRARTDERMFADKVGHQIRGDLDAHASAIVTSRQKLAHAEGGNMTVHHGVLPPS
jgi:hypothetical protein